ncbi:leucine-rich repeat domain-containing protein [endosymbiont GvMRE of Glomus versiforme]|uniref:leucine-rich repeat domain-containing protein n=1 Tax=endosymbiont GvMRE of Glomus versiforme TaxID=2039283 RepID=UPI000EF037DF|nr:leucine-rich repeat domain-containing protein [endosymbiont GvMRE of Glomus versiforme]RHZ35829.1 hypothetical protein GvMRE_Ic4g34 [endosymbiont GvMRE of Glomus versiforme]
MKYNQEWFDKEYPKTAQKIKLTDENFQGQLIIESYLQLEKLHLQDIENINKVTLKNLPQLQECTIWNCGMQDLVIENCPQLKTLNVRRNLLTNLEFLINLENLEELEIDGNIKINSGLEYLPKSLEKLSYSNTKLVEILKQESYKGNWRAFRIVELAKKRPRDLLETISDLHEQNKRLKKELKESNNLPQLLVLEDSNEFEKKYQKLKSKLNSLLKENEARTKEIQPLEKSLATDEILEKIKRLQKSKEALEKQLVSFTNVERKEKKLDEMQREYAKKTIPGLLGGYNKEKIEGKIRKILEFQKDIILYGKPPSVITNKEEIEAKLAKKTRLSIEELDKICILQEEIVQLKKDINQQEKQIINNYNIAGNAIINSTVGDNADLKTITYQSTASSSTSAIVGSSQKAQIEQKHNKWLTWRDKA